jgi:hypothetical protein
MNYISTIYIYIPSYYIGIIFRLASIGAFPFPAYNISVFQAGKPLFVALCLIMRAAKHLAVCRACLAAIALVFCICKCILQNTKPLRGRRPFLFDPIS